MATHSQICSCVNLISRDYLTKYSFFLLSLCLSVCVCVCVCGVYIYIYIYIYIYVFLQPAYFWPITALFFLKAGTTSIGSRLAVMTLQVKFTCLKYFIFQPPRGLEPNLPRLAGQRSNHSATSPSPKKLGSWPVLSSPVRQPRPLGGHSQSRVSSTSLFLGDNGPFFKNKNFEK